MQSTSSLKFGLNKSPISLFSPVTPTIVAPSIMAAAAAVAGPTGEFFLTLGFTGPSGGLETSINFRQNHISPVVIVNWGNGITGTLRGSVNSWDSGVNNQPCGTTVTIRGSNLLEGLSIGSKNGNGSTGDTRLISITGTYPTLMNEFIVRFNTTNPTWTIPPTLPSLSFDRKIGPTSFTTTAKMSELKSPPPNLTTLNLRNSPLMTSLPELPPSLVSLTTPPRLTNITGLTNLPLLTTLNLSGSTGLVSVDLSGLTGLTSLPGFPPSLRSLTTPPKLTTVSGLPASLTSLNLTGSTGLTGVNLSSASGLTVMPSLPLSVTTLTTPPRFANIGSLGVLPLLTSLNLSGSTGLVSADLTNFTELTSLLGFPPFLRSLTTPPKLTSVSGLPASLTSLILTGSTGITGVNLSSASGLTVMPTLPSSVTTLVTPPNITSTGTLPSGLTSLSLAPSTKLTSLKLAGITGITSVSLPSTLVSLDITGCSGLTGVSLPPALAKLKIEGSGLTRLDLTGTSITAINIPPSMYPQLTTLKLSGSKINFSGLLGVEIPPGANWILY